MSTQPREVGYKRAPLSESKFSIYKIAPFDEWQIEEYVMKWFATDGSLNSEEKNNKINAFLQESKKVSDLTPNPLMLSLMCLLYKGEGYIPSNRPDLYEKCSKMLFETWDRSRSISSYTPFEDYFRSTLMYIAFWVYSEESKTREEIEKEDFSDFDFHNEELDDLDTDFVKNLEISKGFDEKIIVRIASEYLKDYFDTYEQAENYAHKLVDFCKNRAWVFTDVGEESYNFTHRTLLEYFTANYLTRKYQTNDSLVDFLFPKVIEGEWLLVSQLALQIKNQASDKAADEIVRELIHRSAQIANEERKTMQIFICSCLQFINFSTKTRLLIFDFIKDILNQDLVTVKIGSFTSGNEYIREIFGELARSTTANKETINKATFNYVSSLIEDKKLENIKFGILLALDIPFLFIDETQHRKAIEWTDLSKSLLSKVTSRNLVEISTNDLETALSVAASPEITEEKIGIIKESIQSHGVNFLLANNANLYSRKLNNMPFLSYLLLKCFKPDFSHYLPAIFNKIGEEVTKNVNNYIFQPPLLKNLNFTNDVSTINKELFTFLKQPDFPMTFFGIFWGFAVLLESGKSLLVTKAFEGTPLGQIFISRYQNPTTIVDQNDLQDYSISPDQIQIIQEWQFKKLNFLKKSVKHRLN